MIKFILVFFLGGALLGGAVAFFQAWMLKAQWQAFLKGLPVVFKTCFQSLSEADTFFFNQDSENLKNISYPIVDEHIEAFLESLKVKMPMIAMFLNPSLTETCKELAREQFLAMIPKFEQLLMRSMNGDQVMEKILQQGALKNYFFAVSREIWRALKWRGVLFGILQGAILGTLYLLL